MGTTRVAWETQYALAYQSTFIYTDDTDATSGVPNATGTFTAAEDGIAAIGASGECGFLLDDKSSFESGVEVGSVDKATGLSQAKTGTSAIGVEKFISRKLPTFSATSGLTTYKAAVLLWSLMQKGASESTFVKTYIPYTTGNADAEMWLAMSHVIGAPTVAKNHVLTGAICTSFGISGSQGERFSVSTEYIGRSFGTVYDHTASVLTAETAADYVFLDFTWTIDQGGGNVTANITQLDCTVVNNAVPVYYNSLYVTKYTMGMVQSSGTFSLAMSTDTIGDSTQIDNFIAGDEVLLIGTSSDSKVIFTINAFYTGGTIDPAETELLVSLPYEGVYDGTNHAFKAVIDDGITRGIA